MHQAKSHGRGVLSFFSPLSTTKYFFLQNDKREPTKKQLNRNKTSKLYPSINNTWKALAIPSFVIHKCYSLVILLNKNVSHCFDVLVSVISAWSFVSTRVGVIGASSSTKPDSGITGYAIIFVVSKDTNSRCSEGVCGIAVAPVVLNPSWLQLGCREASEPISDFHLLRPSEVGR